MSIRIILTNTRDIPSREELCTREREVGEKYFEGFELDWAGYIVEDDTFNLSAQWLGRVEDQDAILHRIEHTELAGYDLRVYLVDDEELEEQQLV